MIDKILERYANNNNPSVGNGGPLPDENEIEDFGTFGFLRGSRERATMLELRKKDGSILAVGYGWLERVDFDPSEGIVLHYAGQRITIKGRNLNVETRPKVKLFEAITRHRVPWIQEIGESGKIAAPRDIVIVDSIVW